MYAFSGGAELLVGNVREHNLSLADQDEPCRRSTCSNPHGNKGCNDVWGSHTHPPSSSTAVIGTIGQLLPYIRDNLLKERPELFMDQGTV